ncbi:hypothetical protein JR334_07050 [Clostridia bacterium]|nr:hypothetical protein JR334_07050 [Clostridia bacterium]
MLKKLNRVRKKFLPILLCLLLLMATFPASSIAEDDSPYSIELVEVTVNGTVVEENVATGPFAIDDEVTFTYGWSIEDGVEDTAGKTVEMALPDIFANATISGQLNDDDGSSYGEWRVENGLITLHFNALAGTQFNVSGGVRFTLKLSLEKVLVDEPYTILIPIDGESSASFILTFEPPEDIESIAKEGSIDYDSGIITWTIDVNQDFAQTGDIEIIDELDRRLQLASDPVVSLYSLEVYSDGTVASGDLIAGVNPLVGVSPSTDENTPHTLTFNIPASAGGDPSLPHAYRIIYETILVPELIDTSATEFIYDNQANLGLDEASASVTRIGAPIIEKIAPASLETNQREFTWEIIINEAKYSLNGVRIEDVLPNGLEIVNLASDVTVIRDGDTPGAPPVLVTPISQSYNETSRKLDIELGDIEGTYRIRIKTNIADSYLEGLDTTGSRFYKLDFANTATLYQTQNGIENSTKDTAKISNLKFGKIIFKSGTADIGYNDQKTVSWTLDVNLGELTTDITQVTDTVGTNLIMPVESDITIKPLTIDGNGDISSGNALDDADYDITISGNDITIDFNDPITQAYRIIYTTKIDENSYDEDVNLTLSNTGTIGFGDGKSYLATVTPKIRNTFNKEATLVDYESNEISWSIQVDPLREGIDELQIVDMLSPELMLLPAQFNAITVNVDQGTAPVKGTDYTVTEELIGGKIKGFTIAFTDGYQVNNAVYTIDYVSTMDPDVIDDSSNYTYGNTISYSWKDGGTSGPVTVYPEIDQDYAQNNGRKTGNLVVEDQKINWTIYINHLSKNLYDYAVRDTVYQSPEGDGEALVSGSVKVLPYTVDQGNSIDTGEALTESELADAGISVVEDLENNSFEVVFNGLLATPYQIQYSTDLVGISSTLYENEATTSLEESFKASVTFGKGDTFVSKSGEIDGDYVNWEIVLNESRSDITSLTLLDTMSPGLEWDEEYYFWMKDSSGSLVAFDNYFDVEWLDKELFSDPTQFRLITKDSVMISDMYTIGYRTSIEPDDLISESFENKVVFDGNRVEEGVKSTTTNIPHTFLSGTGWGSGEVGSISILKTDPDGIPLSGAEFEVYRIKEDDSEVYLGTITTDDDGKATMGNLRNFTYRVQESKAPEGYLIGLGEEAQTETTISSENLNFDWTVVNEPARTLTIVKRRNIDNSDGSPFYLEGARFLVTKENDNSFEETVITDASGKALLEGLEYGTYIIKETKAPSGYALDQTPVEIVVDGSQIDYEVEFFNERERNGGGSSTDPDPDPEIEDEDDPVTDPDPDPETTPDEEETVETDEGEPVGGDVDTPDGSDNEVVDEPDNGTVELGPDGDWTYYPNDGFTGSDSFRIRSVTPDGEVIYYTVNVEVEPLALPYTGAKNLRSVYVMLLALAMTGIFAKKRIKE